MDRLDRAHHREDLKVPSYFAAGTLGTHSRTPPLRLLAGFIKRYLNEVLLSRHDLVPLTLEEIAFVVVAAFDDACVVTDSD